MPYSDNLYDSTEFSTVKYGTSEMSKNKSSSNRARATLKTDSQSLNNSKDLQGSY